MSLAGALFILSAGPGASADANAGSWWSADQSQIYHLSTIFL